MKIEDENMHLLFLQYLDDETYAKLNSIYLNDSERKSIDAFCNILKIVIYGEESTVVQSEVLDCKQLSDESVEEFAYRLKEKALIAFPNEQESDRQCQLTFVRNVKDPHIKSRLNEQNFRNFTEALLLAQKLEKVEKMMTYTPEVTSILKEETSVKFESPHLTAESECKPEQSRNSRYKSRESNNSSSVDSRNRPPYSPSPRTSRWNSPFTRNRSSSRDQHQQYIDTSLRLSKDQNQNAGIATKWGILSPNAGF